jgi:hypothetical protein
MFPTKQDYEIIRQKHPNTLTNVHT